MEQKVILITGCRSGIGLALAVALGKTGHRVYAGLRDVSTSEELDALTKEYTVQSVQLDITVASERKQVVERIQLECGKLDVLINNAGVGIGGFLEELEEDELRTVFEVAVFGTWALTKEVLPLLKGAHRGQIIMISSLSGRMAIPGLGSYCSSKFALEGLSETWRHELKSFGIDVLIVQPGAYRTDMTTNRNVSRSAGTTDSRYSAMGIELSEWYERMVIGRAREPSHLANKVVDLIEQDKPTLRHPIGPSTGWRRLIINLLPFAFLEQYFQRILMRKR